MLPCYTRFTWTFTLLSYNYWLHNLNHITRDSAFPVPYSVSWVLLHWTVPYTNPHFTRRRVLLHLSFLPFLLPHWSAVRARVTLRLVVCSRSVRLEAEPLQTQRSDLFPLNWTSAVIVLIQHHLWRDGSVIYNCCWPSPAHSFLGPSPPLPIWDFLFVASCDPASTREAVWSAFSQSPLR
jgi:hypothetical protein